MRMRRLISIKRLWSMIPRLTTLRIRSDATDFRQLGMALLEDLRLELEVILQRDGVFAVEIVEVRLVEEVAIVALLGRSRIGGRELRLD